MTNLTIEKQADGFYFSGVLTRDSVVSIDNKFIKKTLMQAEVIFDLAQLTKVDSAGLAWLMLCIEKSEQRNCRLQFKNVTLDLLKLAQLSGVESFLPLAENK